MAKQTYAQRIASGMARYLAANPGASDQEARQYARGHSKTGEHGVTITAVGNEIVVSFRSEAKLAQALRAAEKYGGRAAVTVVGKNGKSVTAFQNKGHLAGVTIEHLKQMKKEIATTGGGGAFFRAIGQAGGDHYDWEEAIGSDSEVAEYQLIVY